MLNIGLIDDHESILLGLKSYFSGNYNVVFTTVSPKQSFTLINEYNPDVLIIDLVFPNLDYIEYYTKIRLQFPDIRIISYTSLIDPLVNKSLKKIGVYAVINKNEPLIKLENSINMSMRAEIIDLKTKKHSTLLTPSEFQIVTLLAKGKTTKEISDKLNRSYKTIENHRGNIMSKMEVHNVSQLISKCYQIGILNISEEL